jgi:uncharacterized protein (TIGR03663 family)
MANASPVLLPAEADPRRFRFPHLVLLGVLFAGGIALALRCPNLEYRPMHNDEAVNAIKFGRLWEAGEYKYDPNEYHGPTLHYATWALARLTGAPDFSHFTEARLRAVTVLFGLGLILMLPLTVDGLGRKGTVWAALFTAVSPAFVFYSRYYIHEMLLVFFTYLTLAAGWRYWRSRKIGWALLAGAGFGLMHATKETFVITLTAAGLALALNQIWNRWLDATGSPLPAPRINLSHLSAGLGAWLLIATLLFSSFFNNSNGPLDSIRTYTHWLNRAGGASEHMQPWYFYFQRLLWFHVGKGPVWTEALFLVLAIIGGATGFVRKDLGRSNASFVRFLALYTLLLIGAYTVIGYKTPWCLLNFWHGTILLAGLGAAVLARKARQIQTKIVLTILLLAGSAHLMWQAIQAAIPYAADQRNPYAYAQTSLDVLNLSSRMKALANASGENFATVIKVISAGGDYWPLPWYFRQFKNVGWWDEMPPDPFAPVMIVSAKFNATFDEKKTHLMVGLFQLRPQVFFELYVQIDLWRAYLATRPPEPEE